jgi:hypothetical protein
VIPDDIEEEDVVDGKEEEEEDESVLCRCDDSTAFVTSSFVALRSVERAIARASRSAFAARRLSSTLSRIPLPIHCLIPKYAAGRRHVSHAHATARLFLFFWVHSPLHFFLVHTTHTHTHTQTSLARFVSLLFIFLYVVDQEKSFRLDVFYTTTHTHTHTRATENGYTCTESKRNERVKDVGYTAIREGCKVWRRTARQ